MSAPRPLAATARYLGRGECEALARRVLGFSAADETRVTVNSGNTGNTRFAVNQISTGGDSYNATVSVRVVVGRKVATAATNRLDDESLRDRFNEDWWRNPSAGPWMVEELFGQGQRELAEEQSQRVAGKGLSFAPVIAGIERMVG